VSSDGDNTTGTIDAGLQHDPWGKFRNSSGFEGTQKAARLLFSSSLAAAQNVGF
jgi:hypothetical protein